VKIFLKKQLKGKKARPNQSLSVLFWHTVPHFVLRALFHETNLTTCETKTARSYSNNTICCSFGGRRLVPVAVVVVMRNRAFMVLASRICNAGRARIEITSGFFFSEWVSNFLTCLRKCVFSSHKPLWHWKNSALHGIQPRCRD